MSRASKQAANSSEHHSTRPLVTVLHDLHAIEITHQRLLARQLDGQPDGPVRSHIAARLEVTKAHAKAIEVRLEAFRQAQRTAAKLAMKLTMKLASALGLVGTRSVARCVGRATRQLATQLADQHVKLALYRVLSSTASAAGDPVTVELARRVIAEEESSFGWMAEQMEKDIERQVRSENPMAHVLVWLVPSW